MSIKNTTEAYGSIAKWFHWVSAALFLISYCAIYFRNWFAESEFEKWSSLQLHLSIGITVGVVVTLRIMWRFLNQTPQLEPGSRLEHLAVNVSHYTLYAIMTIMPITGYMFTRANTEYFFLFDITQFRDTQFFNVTGITFEKLAKPADLIHSYLGAWVVWLLILGHILAALHHHFIKKDRTLYKMTSYKL
jgi:cytochrome b561